MVFYYRIFLCFLFISSPVNQEKVPIKFSLFLYLLLRNPQLRGLVFLNEIKHFIYIGCIKSFKPILLFFICYGVDHFCFFFCEISFFFRFFLGIYFRAFILSFKFTSIISNRVLYIVVVSLFPLFTTICCLYNLPSVLFFLCFFQRAIFIILCVCVILKL